MILICHITNKIKFEQMKVLFNGRWMFVVTVGELYVTINRWKLSTCPEYISGSRKVLGFGFWARAFCGTEINLTNPEGGVSFLQLWKEMGKILMRWFYRCFNSNSLNMANTFQETSVYTSVVIMIILDWNYFVKNIRSVCDSWTAVKQSCTIV